MLKLFHRVLRTLQGFKQAVAELPCKEFGPPVQGAFYEPNLISLLRDLPWMTSTPVIRCRTEAQVKPFSVRSLNGVWAGKSPRGTPHDVSYDTFLDYGRALRPAGEYVKANRIGFETAEEFDANCAYLRGKLAWIAATDDGIPLVYHRLWDGTYYLANNDGGNHFAAVYRQCIEQNRDFRFECRLQHQSLIDIGCRRAISGHTVVIVPTSVGVVLAQLLIQFGLSLPPYRPEFQKGKCIMVIGWRSPKDKALSEAMLEVLPNESYFDLGSYVLQLLGMQTAQA